jgi:hypothetical protein
MTDDFSPSDASAPLGGIFDEVVDTVQHVGEGFADAASAGSHYGAGAVDDLMGHNAGANAQYSTGPPAARPAAT